MAVILRAVFAYFFLLAMMRLLGRRAPNQSSPFEIILILLFGGLVVQAVIDDDRSLTNIILAIMTVGMIHLGVSTLKLKFPLLGKVIDGTPVVVFSNGEWHRDVMESLKVEDQDIMAQARKNGVERMELVKYAIVERNGSISIIRKQRDPRTEQG